MRTVYLIDLVGSELVMHTNFLNTFREACSVEPLLKL